MDPILELASSEVSNALLNVEDVCHSLVPGRFKPTNDNKVGLYLHPILITTSGDGYLYMLDVNSVGGRLRLIELQLHNCTILFVCKYFVWCLKC